MGQDPLSGADGLVLQNLGHQIRQGDRNFIRPGMSEGNGQGGLRIRVHKQNPFSFLCKANPQIFAGGGFAGSAFLIHNSHDCGF